VIEEQLVRHGALAWRTLAQTLAGEACIAALDNGMDMALALKHLYADQEGHEWTQNLPGETPWGFKSLHSDAGPSFNGKEN
jgi:hypothetical protein